MPFEIKKFEFEANIKAPLRFAVISDLHGCDNEPILSAIEQENVDAVLVVGDFIHNNKIFESGIEMLALCAKKWSTFCVLGNHEKRFNGNIKALVKETGAICLDDNFFCFGGLVIGGLTSAHKSEKCEPNLEFLMDLSKEQGFKCLLCHHPEYYEPYIKELNIDLILSGHAHGGQWRFFGQGIYAPGQGLFPKYTSGLYDGRLLVSRGLGNPHFIPRINNKSQIIIVDIKNPHLV